MTKTSAEPPVERELLWAALDLPQEKREKFIQEESKGDTALVERLLALIQNAEEESLFMAKPAVAMSHTTPVKSDAIGTRIGRYKLMEQVGEGGMGIVYVAEQAEPVRRTVALKLIKPGMDTKQVIARFEAERQALALMDHPNIARVIDAGTTDRGLPYFVMELVRGLPITEYCDKAKLSPNERLQLFRTVCSAVQHAHLKGIIHRDLKPNNILVTLHDGVPVVKVIDFGVAKALNQQLTQHTVYTALNQVMGTPMYMSPEQLELSGLDIDTRTDVYSLGVLLYELLTGVPPFDRDELYKSGIDELRRIIREQDPPRPSIRVTTLDEKSKSTNAQRRGLDQRTFLRSYKGELDWIVMKALEKDRNRRYESASAMASDIRRYLENGQVEACPPSLRYRLSKFARRNRVLLTTGTLIIGALFAGALISTWQAIVANHAERRAIAKSDLARRAVDEMYSEVAEKWLAEQGNATALQRQFLEKALQYYSEFAAENTESRAVRWGQLRAMERVAAIQLKLGANKESEENYRNLIQQCRDQANSPADRCKTLTLALNSCLQYNGLLDRLGKKGESGLILQEAIQIATELLTHRASTSEEQANRADAFRRLGVQLNRSGRRPESEEFMQAALGICETLVSEHPGSFEFRRDYAACLYSQATQRMWWGDRKEEARVLFCDARNRLLSLLEERSTDRKARQSLASVYKQLGFLDGDIENHTSALDNERKAVAIIERLLDDFPNDQFLLSDYVRVCGNMISSLSAIKTPETLAEVPTVWSRQFETLSRLCELYPDVHDFSNNFANVTRNRFVALARQGDKAEALAFSESPLRVLSKSRLLSPMEGGTGRHGLIHLICNVACLRLESGEYLQAEKLMLQVEPVTTYGQFDQPIIENATNKSLVAGEVLASRCNDFISLSRCGRILEECSRRALADTSCSESRKQELIARFDQRVKSYRQQASLARSAIQEYLAEENGHEAKVYAFAITRLSDYLANSPFELENRIRLEVHPAVCREIVELYAANQTCTTIQASSMLIEKLVAGPQELRDPKLATRLAQDQLERYSDYELGPYYCALANFRSGEFQLCLDQLLPNARRDDITATAIIAMSLDRLGRRQEALDWISGDYEGALAKYIKEHTSDDSDKGEYFPSPNLLKMLDQEMKTLFQQKQTSELTPQ